MHLVVHLLCILNGLVELLEVTASEDNELGVAGGEGEDGSGADTAWGGTGDEDYAC